MTLAQSSTRREVQPLGARIGSPDSRVVIKFCRTLLKHCWTSMCEHECNKLKLISALVSPVISLQIAWTLHIDRTTKHEKQYPCVEMTCGVTFTFLSDVLSGANWPMMTVFSFSFDVRHKVSEAQRVELLPPLSSVS